MKHRAKGFLVAAGLAGLAASGQAQPVQMWGRFLNITVNTTATGGGANIAAPLAEFPLLVRLNTTNAAAVLSEALPGGADIRFADAAGNPIPFEIEQWSSTAAAIWVRVPLIAANGNTGIRLYWGRNGVASASSGSAVFNSSNGYEAVFHMNEPAGDTIRDVTPNGYKGIPVIGSTAGSTAPKDTAGVIGVAKAFGGNIANTAAGAQTGGAYRLETATGGNTYNSFDYTGEDARFTMSVWTNFNAYPADFPRRRGILTKADHGVNQLDNNDPLTQWFLRPNITARVMHFQRVAAVGYSTAPYSIVETGGLPGVLNNWNYVSYAANGAGVNDNLFRLYNETGATFRTTADEPGMHVDVDVFIGGFASNSGPGGQKSSGTHFLNGAIDEVRISNVARPAAWSDLEYATQKATVTAVTYGAAQANDTSRVMMYPVRSATFLANAPITPITPFVKAGNTVTAWAITPALSAGLSFNTGTGVISGTPTAVSASTQYVVTATIGGNPHRDTLTFTVATGTPPDPPTGVVAVAGNAQATVTWSAPASSGSTAITSYTVLAVQDTTKSCTRSADSTRTCTVTGLTNGTSYTFVVRAANSVGVSASSAASAAVTPATVPDAPTNVVATPVGGSTPSVRVTWTAPANTGGSAILSYTVTGTPGGNCFASATASPLGCTVSGLTANVSHSFTVRATNAVGQGAVSASATATPVGILPGAFVFRVSGMTQPFTFVLPQEALASTEKVTMTISDIWGRTVWSRSVDPATHGAELTWNGRASNGRPVSAGMYVVRVSVLRDGRSTEYLERTVTLKPL